MNAQGRSVVVDVDGVVNQFEGQSTSCHEIREDIGRNKP
jgi:hypothetical protein